MDERGATNLCDLLTAQNHESALTQLPVASSLYFIVLQGTTPGEMIRLEPGVQSLGRAPENGVQIPDMSVSRRHGTLIVDDEGLAWFTDLGSTNGSALNGQRL